MKLKKILMVLLLVASSHATNAQDKDINLLNKIAYGAKEQSVEQLEKQGSASWLRSQLFQDTQLSDLEIEKRHDFPRNNDELFTEYKKNDFNLHSEINQNYFTGSNGVIEKNLRKRLDYALHSENELREMMVWFWFNHFNVSPRSFTTTAIFTHDFETRIRRNALGKFSDLLTMVAHHPAMLYFLNNNVNKNPQPGQKAKLNENYAREFLELHTMGVDGGYTQKDVEQLARILTGFTLIELDEYMQPGDAIDTYAQLIEKVRSSEDNVLHETVIKDFFIFQGKFHDYKDKELLAQKVHGTGYDELAQAIEIILKHPATARFICRKMATYLMSDMPSEELVEKMAHTFMDSGTDIAQVMMTLFGSDEFMQNVQDPSKIKDPYYFMISTVKTAYKPKQYFSAQLLDNMVSYLTSIKADPYAKSTPEGLSISGKNWLSNTRLKENMFFVQLLVESRDFMTPKESLNRAVLEKMARQPITSAKDIVRLLASEKWLKR